MKLCIIGTGYVGLTTGTCLASIGHEVVCTDSDRAKIDGLQHGILPIFEERLADLVCDAVAGGRLTFSADTAAAVEGSEAIFICVGTPPDQSGRANMAAVESVARLIAEHATSCKFVIGKSTVPVHTGESIRRVLQTYGTGRFQFDIASNPEFLREGTAVLDFFHPDRIVVGTDNKSAAQHLRAIYAPILMRSAHCGWHRRPLGECSDRQSVWLETNIASAELIKHASNSFLGMKVSYANAVAEICELAGAEADEVLKGMGLDHRIGQDFLCPGIGFGGFCLPKDLSAFVDMAGELGYEFNLLREVQAINEQSVTRFVRKVQMALWVVAGKTIGVLGLAFKAGTDDTRLSPAYAVVRELIRMGARLRAFDPKAMARAERELSGNILYCNGPEEVAEGADAIIVLTDWPQFQQADWASMGARMRRRLVLDGRNLLKPQELKQLGFQYHAVGRHATLSHEGAARSGR